MRADELDYTLPDSLIAQVPLARRSASRLLVVDRESRFEHRKIEELAELLPPSLWVVNETRVIPARLRGHKESGGKCELLLIEPLAPTSDGRLWWKCLGRANKPLRVNMILEFGSLKARVEERLEGGHLHMSFGPGAESFDAALEQYGELPLPPYIKRQPDVSDRDRYQTVFAAQPGAVAAPTAGLHFDDVLIGRMKDAGHSFTRVVLHVGPGTFRPVKCDDLDDHPMHEERFEVGETAAKAVNQARRDGRPVVAVGTTSVRCLEASSVGHDGLIEAREGRTRLFIQPGYQAKVVDHLLTNFHLPRSTLLALVMAFGGSSMIRAAYEAAVAEEYRFFSYGDAMLIRGIRAEMR